MHRMYPFFSTRIKQRMSEILATLAGTFTTCACGAKARDCAFAQMAKFVNSAPLTPSEQEKGSDMADGSEDGTPIDLGPTVGKRRQRLSAKLPNSCVGPQDQPPLPEPSSPLPHASSDPQTSFPIERNPVGTGSLVDTIAVHNADSAAPHLPVSSPDTHGDDVSVNDLSLEEKPRSSNGDLEERLPPRLRKNWIRKAALDRDIVVPPNPPVLTEPSTSCTPSIDAFLAIPIPHSPPYKAMSMNDKQFAGLSTPPIPPPSDETLLDIPLPSTLPMQIDDLATPAPPAEPDAHADTATDSTTPLAVRCPSPESVPRENPESLKPVEDLPSITPRPPTPPSLPAAPTVRRISLKDYTKRRRAATEKNHLTERGGPSLSPEVGVGPLPPVAEHSPDPNNAEYDINPHTPKGPLVSWVDVGRFQDKQPPHSTSTASPEPICPSSSPVVLPSHLPALQSDTPTDLKHSTAEVDPVYHGDSISPVSEGSLEHKGDREGSFVQDPCQAEASPIASPHEVVVVEPLHGCENKADLSQSQRMMPLDDKVNIGSLPNNSPTLQEDGEILTASPALPPEKHQPADQTTGLRERQFSISSNPDSCPTGPRDRHSTLPTHPRSFIPTSPRSIPGSPPRYSPPSNAHPRRPYPSGSQSRALHPLPNPPPRPLPIAPRSWYGPGPPGRGPPPGPRGAPNSWERDRDVWRDRDRDRDSRGWRGRGRGW
ncbi:hypothetical protein BOTBODRAFT_459884 [Botryobasidium botryosum FD-172 SS1]|uniref:Uncharacterized protein n=1 Tax=Botryobasidium botryosum (strain FD-172 SS1) TaxID=930990 RepID=A0A067M6I2_BOTB1|nr:hypothetical protein BOTBODRAFT_459884 [Botryobasidium botryosum FD-172 SS1]